MARKKLMTTCYIRADQDEALHAIRKKTKIPIAVLIREGIDLMLEYRNEELTERQRHRKQTARK